MKSLLEKDASAEMKTWWNKQQRGDTVTKVLWPGDYPEAFAGILSYSLWCQDKTEESIAAAFQDPYYSRVRQGYADLAAERIRAGVEVTRIVLMDMEAMEKDRRDWRNWVREVQLPHVITPLTGETAYCLPLSEVSPEVRRLDHDVNVFTGSGLMATFYDETGVTHRDFYYQEVLADQERILAARSFVSSVLGMCREEHRILSARQ